MMKTTLLHAFYETSLTSVKFYFISLIFGTIAKISPHWTAVFNNLRFHMVVILSIYIDNIIFCMIMNEREGL